MLRLKIGIEIGIGIGIVGPLTYRGPCKGG